MAKLLSVSQIREWDEYTIRHESISSIDLMERAARVCVQWLLEHKHEPKRAYIIYCGIGNNGGDGLAIARLMLDEGFKVQVILVGDGQRSEDNLKNLKELEFLMPASIQPFEKAYRPDPNSIIIDALFGTGLSRKASGQFSEAIDQVNRSGNQVISIDIPSGLNADQELVGANVVNANTTLTFQQLKWTFLFPETGKHCGKVVVLDIQLNPGYLDQVNAIRYTLDQEVVENMHRSRPQFAHKGTFGHAFLMAGSHGKMGAAILAARACLRSGTGLLTLLVPEEENVIIQTAVPEAMSLTYETTSALATLSNFNAIAAGPGIGNSENARECLNQLMTLEDVPLVLDADALNLLSESKELMNKIPKGSLITPHPKEFDRLFGSHQTSFDRHKTQLEMSARYQIYIILKGRYTCITTPAGESWFNTIGNPGMATGGSGDVLTGILLALMVQRYTILDSSLMGVYLHALAGDMAAAQLTEESMIASDIISHLPQAFRKVFYSAGI